MANAECNSKQPQSVEPCQTLTPRENHFLPSLSTCSSYCKAHVYAGLDVWLEKAAGRFRAVFCLSDH